MTLTIGSLFSGIGGLEFGLERAGLGPVRWQCEIDPFCRSILAQHWPDAVRFEDVRAIDETTWGVDLICGGFPCQDISDAGKKAGIEGAKSGLWFEYARIIRLLRPRVVVIENVAALARRGLDRVLGELAAAGYNAEWTTLCANDVGAPHERARLFVVAYAASEGLEGVLDTELQRALRRTEGDLRRHWATAPNVALVADGLPRGMAKPRVKALGNAVVPQCAEVLGRAIVAALH